MAGRGVRGFEEQLVEVETDARELTVTLSSGVRPVVSGRVTAEGLPVAGAHVDLVLPDRDLVDRLVEPLPGGWHYCEDDWTTTDAAGAFRIPNEWPRYGYRVRAWDDGFAAAYSNVVQGAARGLELALAGGGSLAGRVRLASGQDPAGLTLRAHRADVRGRTRCLVGRRFTARVGNDGAYRFEHLEPGTWLVVPELPPGRLQELAGVRRTVRPVSRRRTCSRSSRAERRRATSTSRRRAAPAGCAARSRSAARSARATRTCCPPERSLALTDWKEEGVRLDPE